MNRYIHRIFLFIDLIYLRVMHDLFFQIQSAAIFSSIQFFNTDKVKEGGTYLWIKRCTFKGNNHCNIVYAFNISGSLPAQK